MDRVLTQILGRAATQIIYDYLESSYSIRKHEIAAKLDAFNTALEQYLGTGAYVIEKAILENFGSNGFEEDRDVDFSDREKILKLI